MVSLFVILTTKCACTSVCILFLFYLWHEMRVYMYFIFISLLDIIVYMYVDNINFQYVVEIHGIIGYCGGQKCCIEFLNKIF